MPNIGPLELIVILVILLLVVGPGKLPDVGQALGKTLKEFRKASSDIQETANIATGKAPAPNQLSGSTAPNVMVSDEAPEAVQAARDVTPPDRAVRGAPSDPIDEG
jgi:sec-independent protein translocase protein TatA